MTEEEIQRILKQDLSKGAEAFRDALLARCLEVVDSGVSDDEALELADADLDLLAAAGLPETAFGSDDADGVAR